tara:strand:- start:18 stop:428 length:411 start_codon:yes stop_codon:yes gene_type:complete
MGFIYKIEVGEECYIGSTKNILQRQTTHNQGLNNPNSKDYNIPLYKYCREHNIKKIICKKVEEVEDNNIKIKEQEYINNLKPILNSNRVYQTQEEKEEQKKILNKKHNNIKSNCPICNKEMLRQNIKRHILRKHNI